MVAGAGAAACIDIGSNTTRLLVARCDRGRLRAVREQRAFTRLGRELTHAGRIRPIKLAEVAEVVAAQVLSARQAGAGQVRVVATAAIRQAANGAELAGAVRERAGVPVTVLDDSEEARLAFLGATRTLGHPVDGEVAVADVGGGSSELAIGRVAAGVVWSTSFAVGSGSLADAYLRSDPPATDELQAVRQHVDGALEGLAVEQPALAVAAGGSAGSLRRLVGDRLEPETLGRAVRVLASTPIAEVARRFELEPERVRILPGGILILEALSVRLGCPLQIGNGGLREGVVLELLGVREEAG